MKCDECLPVIEEYFDGETDQHTGELIAAHLSICEDCRDAFDALDSERERYAAYRRDIEVTPALWQAVQSGIEAGKNNADAAPLAHAPLSPPASRRRTRFAAFLDALPRLTLARFSPARFSPVYAAALALVAIGFAAALIWHHDSQNLPSQHDIARQPATGSKSVAPVVSPANEATALPGKALPGKTAASPEALNNEVAAMPTARDKRAVGVRRAPVAARAEDETRKPRKTQSSPSLQTAAATTTAANTTTTVHGAYRHDHPVAVEWALASASLPDTRIRRSGSSAVVGDDEELAHTRLLNVKEVEVARHIRKTQLLLRSFRNGNDAGDEAASDIAYEKRLSRQLLNENTLLRGEVEHSNNLPTRQLLNTLEPLLLDIANLEDKPSPQQVRSIKERMRKMEIIATLEVYD